MDDMTMEFEIFGEITTVEAFQDLSKALAPLDQFEGEANSRQALIDANLEGNGLRITEYSYDYRSNVRDNVLMAAKRHNLLMVSTLTFNGSRHAGDMQPSRRDWISIMLPVLGREIVLRGSDVAELRERGTTPLNQLDDFVSNFKSDDHPPFWVADEVIAEIFPPKHRP